MTDLCAQFIAHLQEQEITHRSSLVEAMKQPAPVSIRWNPAKLTHPPTLKEPVPWCSTAEYLRERPSFYLDPLWHAGAYYVQEASSMFTGYIIESLSLPNGSRYLDLCAAPGGKSTHIASLLKEDDLLVANETIASRNNILVENITRWGKDGVVVTQNSPAAFQSLGPWFDCMVVDAPCSGSGLFRKMPEAIQEWSTESVANCAVRKNSILEDILPALQQNGYLIYATCSFSHLENEANVDSICSRFPLESIDIAVPEAWGILRRTTKNGHTCYHFHPDRLEGEGFFVAVMQLRETVPGTVTSNSGQPPIQQADENIVAAVQGIADTGNREVISFKDAYFLLPPRQFYTIAQLHSHLYIKLHGTAIGEMKGKNLVPAHGLAMHPQITFNVPDFPLDAASALSYLRKSDIYLDNNYTGWATVSYNGLRLGWIKKIPQRINNYYPMGYRLRK